MKQIHTEGFGIAQVWEQARRVLDASREEIEQSFPEVVLDNVGLKKPDEFGRWGPCSRKAC